MPGKLFAGVFLHFGQRHAALQHIRSQARSIRGQKWKREISSLDVRRERAMLPP
jgi:hypothetical protein